jgi:ribosome biogenesis GTPase
VLRPAGVDVPGERGVVLSGTGGVWQVRTEGGETRDASLRGRLKKADSGKRADGTRRRDTVQAATENVKLAVGDEVVIEEGERGGAWAITTILPRRSRLARRVPGGGYGERVVAANVDQVVVVFAAAKPEPHPRMLDRFLVIAEGNALAARIVVNKTDVVGEAAARERFADYARAGYPLHFTSVVDGAGIQELREALHGRISALSGPSGVGKSSLLNTLYPGLNLRVGEISESVNKGRHTTVGALLHPLPDGGFVADTPGLREVGMWGLPPGELDRCFPEIRPLIESCRFADCTHSVEPGCAVRTAVEAGEVSEARYESYRKLREELEELERTERGW